MYLIYLRYVVPKFHFYLSRLDYINSLKYSVGLGVITFITALCYSIFFVKLFCCNTAW